MLCLFDMILYVPSTIFQLKRNGSSWVEPVLSKDKCVLLKDHNAVTQVRLEPAASSILCCHIMKYTDGHKKNATIEFCPVRHVVHKPDLHELTMTRTLSFEFIDFLCMYQACWLIYMNILT